MAIQYDPSKYSLEEKGSDRILTGQSMHTQQVNRQIQRIAKTNLTVLIQGETGTGKELVARCIHMSSDRAEKPFIAVDCGALSESLLESTLFGHRKGAFTGADQRRVGYFELAKGGTLFLDEIVNLPLSAQAKLLRCVQERRMFPLGSEQEVPVDIRLLIATNLPLEDEVQAGRFRRDLFHRLNEFKIYLLPLHGRGDDVLLLAEQFRQEANGEFQRHARRFSPDAQHYLLTYTWPGNVRELRNTIRRAVLLSTDVIEIRHLCQPSEKTPGVLDVPPPIPDVYASQGCSLPDLIDKVVQDLEKTIITRVLHENNGNKSKAARHLQIGYKTLQRKLKAYGIQGPRSPRRLLRINDSTEHA